jgi:hypothetical protein
VNGYELLYSLVLFSLPNAKNCHLSTITIVYSLTTNISRFISYNIWVFPIIFHFWPGDKSCCCFGKQNEMVERRES